MQSTRHTPPYATQTPCSCPPTTLQASRLRPGWAGGGRIRERPKVTSSLEKSRAKFTSSYSSSIPTSTLEFHLTSLTKPRQRVPQKQPPRVEYDSPFPDGPLPCGQTRTVCHRECSCHFIQPCLPHVQQTFNKHLLCARQCVRHTEWINFFRS